MRIAALLLAAFAAATSAQAQTAPADGGFLPIPDMSPPYMFAPHPLSGTMLKPLIERGTHAETEVRPEPGPEPVAIANTLPLPESVPESAPSVTAMVPVEPPASDPTAELATGAVPEEEAIPEPPSSGIVTVIVENVQSDGGVVNVAVCDKDLSQAGCPYTRQVPAARGFVETQFDHIPPGNYAVVGYHDVNGNDEFDKLFGMPREPYALSNNAGDKLVPTFRDAAMPINAGPNAIVIRLQRLGG